MPRNTTHVPTSDVQSAVSRAAANALRIVGLSVNGSIHHDHGSERKSMEGFYSPASSIG